MGRLRGGTSTREPIPRRSPATSALLRKRKWGLTRLLFCHELGSTPGALSREVGDRRGSEADSQGGRTLRRAERKRLGEGDPSTSGARRGRRCGSGNESSCEGRTPRPRFDRCKGRFLALSGSVRPGSVRCGAPRHDVHVRTLPLRRKRPAHPARRVRPWRLEFTARTRHASSHFATPKPSNCRLRTTRSTWSRPPGGPVARCRDCPEIPPAVGRDDLRDRDVARVDGAAMRALLERLRRGGARTRHHEVGSVAAFRKPQDVAVLESVLRKVSRALHELADDADLAVRILAGTRPRSCSSTRARTSR